MPAPDTGGTKSPAGARAIVETLGLHAGDLGDGDLSALAVQHSGDQFSSSELETLANIQAELEGFNTTVGVEGSLEDEDLDAGEDSLGPVGTIESVVTISSRNHGRGETPSPEAILPEITEETTQEMDIHDIAMSPPSPEQELTVQLSSSSSHHQLSASCNSLNITPTSVTSKNPQTAGSSIVVIQSPVAPSTSGVPTSVSVSGGQIVGKISGLSSNLAASSVPQFQSITQTLVTAKSADGNIVQLRPTGISKPLVATSSSNFTHGSLQGIKPLQATIKRPATSGSGQMRNVYAKVIITGNQHNQQGQPIMLATSQSGDTFTTGQPIKIISSSSGQGTLLGSPTKAITLAQAQQLGLISPTKLQQIMPTSPNKQSIIVNKLVSSPSKITMMPASTMVKSPTKILPAPTSGITQLKPATVSVASVSGVTTAATTVNTNVKPLGSPQKVIIRQGPLKPGTVLTSSAGSGQLIRIPATQNVMATSGNLTQLQIPGGRQLQYVRLVSAAGSNTSTVSTVTTVAKPRTTTMVPVTSISGSVRPVALSSVHVPPQTVKMVHIAPATPAVRTVAPKTTTGQPGQRILIPASAPVSQLRPGTNVTTLPATAVNQLTSGAAILPSGANSYVMLPAQYVQQVRNLQNQQSQQQQPQLQPQPPQPPQLPQSQAQPPQQSVLKTQNTGSTPCHTSNNSSSIVEPLSQTRSSSTTRTTLEPNGIRPRKPCNCTKSQCLKLYCDCFANGEFCHMCNCNNCFNNLEHEEDRQRAIKACLERNPNAFRPKIGKGIVGDERRHNKGCNCKRSGCLKNYCECYEAKIPCSNNCKCVGCRNVEESSDKKSLRDLAEAAEVRVQQQTAVKNKLSAQIQDIAFRPQPSLHNGSRQPFNFMTQEVLDATCQCLLARSEEAERFHKNEEETEQLIIEEFGRCLVQIIECASKTEANTAPM